MNSIYQNGTYLERNPTWHQEDAAWKAGQIALMLKRHCLSPQSIAEVGCGAGGVLRELARLLGDDIRYEGYDISPQAIELCQSLGGAESLSFRLGNLLEVKDVYFDLVLAIDVFEHVEDYMGFLRTLQGRGAYKLFHVPLDMSVQAVLRGSPILEARRKVGHLHYFSKETALATLADTGYSIVDSFYTGSAVRGSGGGWKRTLMSFPRRSLFAVNEDAAARILGGYSLMVLAR
jgi:cyclopropane fatty-acyl-phospholipid synthase-like methyltransferase